MDLVKSTYKNIRTIVLSRIKKPNQEKYVIDRRAICKECKFNSKNQESLSLKVRLLIMLSDFYTWITLNEKTELGTCAHKNCGCDIFYKSIETDEKCPEGYWSIYKPNSSKTKRGIKNGNT